ncbi:MAG: hypothetical protein ISS49_14670 [Anaerolineae bacterium]|nr:hypothetical protein [Anaerolineae bacterium]
MENVRGKLVLALMTLMLLLVLALGPAAPGAAARMAEPQAGEVEVWDALDGLLCPSAHSGSGGG